MACAHSISSKQICQSLSDPFSAALVLSRPPITFLSDLLRDGDGFPIPDLQPAPITLGLRVAFEIEYNV